MTKEEIENYFVECAGYGRDKVRNFMDIVNKALEQKNERITELEQKLEQAEKDLADYQFNYPTIKELQKEIAELKKKNLDTQDAVTMQMYTNKANKEIADRQLTKAKEIIHKVCYEYGIYDKDLMEEAKQFLNSEVEK